jgi:hypothetical protein
MGSFAKYSRAAAIGQGSEKVSTVITMRETLHAVDPPHATVHGFHQVISIARNS